MQINSVSSAVYTAGPQRMQATATQGLQEATARLQEDFQRLSRGDISPERVASVNSASFVYSMNIQLLKIADEMTGQVLDLLA